MEQHTLKNVNNCWNTKIIFYLKISGGQNHNLYLNVVHFLAPVLIRHLWELKNVFFCIGVYSVLFYCHQHNLCIHVLMFVYGDSFVILMSNSKNCTHLLSLMKNTLAYFSTQPPKKILQLKLKLKTSFTAWTSNCFFKLKFTILGLYTQRFIFFATYK